MWAVDPYGEFRFSDATNKAQQVLFEGDQTALLWSILEKTLAGKTITTDEILGYVEDAGFLDKHMKAVLKQHEDLTLPPAKQIQVRDRKRDGNKRRKGTFPEGVVVTFPKV